MSLIDEALRRARQEAALQDSAKRDAQYRQVPVYAPPQARRAGPTLIAATVAACVIAGVGVGLFLGSGGGETPGQAAVEAPEPTPPPVAAPQAAPEPEPTPVPVREKPSESRQVPAAEAEHLQPPPVLDAPPTPAPAEPVVAPEPTTTPAPVPPAPEAAPEPPAAEIRTYVREVPLPDGGVLRLSGIAFSSAQPVALINDRVLAKGETYQGFLVSDIQANLVELRGNGMTVRVTLK